MSLGFHYTIINTSAKPSTITECGGQYLNYLRNTQPEDLNYTFSFSTDFKIRDLVKSECSLAQGT